MDTSLSPDLARDPATQTLGAAKLNTRQARRILLQVAKDLEGEAHLRCMASLASLDDLLEVLGE